MAAERHGSRWLHEHPSEDQLQEWFKSQSLHDGMDHSPYMGGIVVIGAKEKVNVTAVKSNGDTYVKEQERAVFVPYVKVDTRIAYFWNLVRAMNGGEDKYIGVIEPVGQRIIDDASSAYFNAHLPEGFSIMPVRNSNDSISRFLICTQMVAIYERQSWLDGVATEGKPPPIHVVRGIASKQTPLARNWADDNALMKAETGAVGRACGMAGILVVGTGVATAEDMQEAAAGQSGAAASAGAAPVLPEVEGGGVAVAEAPAAADVGAGVQEKPTAERTDEELRELALGLQQEMAEHHPQVWAAYREWWKQRQFGPIAEMSGPQLRGAVVKLERDLDAAKTGPPPDDTTDPGPA